MLMTLVVMAAGRGSRFGGMKQVAGIGPAVYPTGNVHEDIEKVMAFYRTKTGKFPENGVR